MQKPFFDCPGHSRGHLSNGKVNILSLYICKTSMQKPLLIARGIAEGIFPMEKSTYKVFIYAKIPCKNLF